MPSDSATSGAPRRDIGDKCIRWAWMCLIIPFVIMGAGCCNATIRANCVVLIPLWLLLHWLLCLMAIVRGRWIQGALFAVCGPMLAGFGFLIAANLFVALSGR